MAGTYALNHVDPIRSFSGKQPGEVTGLTSSKGENYKMPFLFLEWGYRAYERIRNETHGESNIDFSKQIGFCFAAIESSLSVARAAFLMLSVPPIFSRAVWEDLDAFPPCDKLLIYLQLGKLARQTGIPPPKLSETGYCFLSLYVIDKAVEQHRLVKEHEGALDQLLYLHELLVRITETQDFLQGFDSGVSVRAKDARAARTRLESMDKNTVIEFYEAHKNTLKTQIAIAGAIKDKRLVNQTLRTIERWISEYKKSKA